MMRHETYWRAIWDVNQTVTAGESAGEAPQATSVNVTALVDMLWAADHWSNTQLSGDPAVQRAEPGIAYDWGYGSPDQRVFADRFSARWVGIIDVSAGPISSRRRATTACASMWMAASSCTAGMTTRR